jgi:hypothetical protein
MIYNINKLKKFISWNNSQHVAIVNENKDQIHGFGTTKLLSRDIKIFYIYQISISIYFLLVK